MNVNYTKYLFLMAFIVCGAVLVSAILIYRGRRNRAPGIKGKGGNSCREGDLQSRKGNTQASGSIKPVNGGNISIFVDKQENVTIIPYVADLFGAGKATSNVSVLCQPYKAGKLGAAIRNSLASCHNGKPTGSLQLMEKLQYHSWKEFSEDKLNLSVYYKEGIGIVFNTTVRTSKGAYIFNTRGMEHCLPANASDETIGSTSLELFKRCRR